MDTVTKSQNIRFHILMPGHRKCTASQLFSVKFKRANLRWILGDGQRTGNGFGFDVISKPWMIGVRITWIRWFRRWNWLWWHFNKLILLKWIQKWCVVKKWSAHGGVTHGLTCAVMELPWWKDYQKLEVGFYAWLQHGQEVKEKAQLKLWLFHAPTGLPWRLVHRWQLSGKGCW